MRDLLLAVLPALAIAAILGLATIIAHAVNRAKRGYDEWRREFSVRVDEGDEL
jgi:hypothetical protein